MGLRKKQALPNPDVPVEALKRVENIPSSDLQVWFESAYGGMGVTYDGWLRGDVPDEEITVTIQALWAMWQEMLKRGAST